MQTRIILRPEIGATAHKIMKIVSLDDGRFSVLTPYHSARRGYLLKVESSLAPGRRKLPRTENIEEFSAGDLVKLSMHFDGFTQFSGERSGTITSGRNADGSPKGLAVLSEPLSVINQNRPSFSVTVWGLRGFDVFTSPAGPENLVFDHNSISAQPTEELRAGGFFAEGFLIPASRRSEIVPRLVDLGGDDEVARALDV